MNRKAIAATLGAVAMGLATSTVALAADRVGQRVVRVDPKGDTSAGTVRLRSGPNGGAVLRGRTVKADGQGNARVLSGAAVRGPQGGKAVRAGTTSVQADGSASHQSGVVAEGERGRVVSYGEAVRDASGAVTQSRNTTATGSATGNSVTSTSSYSKEAGRTRSTQCFDSSGASIACPTRP